MKPSNYETKSSSSHSWKQDVSGLTGLKYPQLGNVVLMTSLGLIKLVIRVFRVKTDIMSCVGVRGA